MNTFKCLIYNFLKLTHLMRKVFFRIAGDHSIQRYVLEVLWELLGVCYVDEVVNVPFVFLLFQLTLISHINLENR